MFFFFFSNYCPLNIFFLIFYFFRVTTLCKIWALKTYYIYIYIYYFKKYFTKGFETIVTLQLLMKRRPGDFCFEKQNMYLYY